MAKFLGTIFGKLEAKSSYWIIIALLFLGGSIPLFFTVDAPAHGDVQLYSTVAQNLFWGDVPYRDSPLEYPPYAVLLFALPWAVCKQFLNYDYRLAFVLFAAVADCLLKALIIREAQQVRPLILSLLPLALYCFAVPFISHFYLQRYDVFPALLVLLSLIAFQRRHFVWSGAILAIATGVKLYPCLIAPVMWVLGTRRGARGGFVWGFVIGIAPLLLSSFAIPWWNFLRFHNERGLQVESLYASIIWLAHLGGWTDAEWASARAWMEVQGIWSFKLLPWVKLTMLLTTFGSVGFCSWVAFKAREVDFFRLCRLCLVPVLAFVAFNVVFSPQYMVWLLPLAALGGLNGKKWPAIAVAGATMLTPAFYPSQEYGTGLLAWQTCVLLLRNLTLVYVWIALGWEFWREVDNPASTPYSASTMPA